MDEREKLIKVIYGKNGKPITKPQEEQRSAWFRRVSKWKHQLREVRMGHGDYDGQEMRDKVDEVIALRGFEGNLFSSEILGSGGKHTIALDIDVPMHTEASSTTGHHHLFIDVEVEWDDYAELLTLLGRLGVLEDGYVQASLRRRATDLRLPWVNKADLPDQDGLVQIGADRVSQDLLDRDDVGLFQISPPPPAAEAEPF